MQDRRRVPPRVAAPLAFGSPLALSHLFRWTMKGLRPGRGRLALRAGPIWLVADDILHRHVLGPGLLLHGASDVRALVEPDCAEPRGGGGGASAEQPVGEQDDAGQEKRAELDLDLGFFRLGDAQCAETLLPMSTGRPQMIVPTTSS
jgi:hypothetical protein